METHNIQQFSDLIVLDLHLAIVGISHNISQFISSFSKDQVMGRPVQTIFTDIFGPNHLKIIKVLMAVANDQQPRTLLLKKIRHKMYYVKICKADNLIYLELEPQQSKYFSASNLNDIGFLFEHPPHTNWTLVCKAIHKILHYDRVVVLRVQENGYSKVLAEYTNHKILPFNQKEFSSHFMPSDVILSYKDMAYRYLPDITSVAQHFYTIHPNTDLKHTQLSFPPDIHIRYLNSMNIRSAVFFPLHLQDNFWGLVIAHSYGVKVVDLQIRKICTFIIQNAMNKYETQVKQGLLDINIKIKTLQHDLLERLPHHDTINCALVESLENLRTMLQADGIAIYNEGDVYFNGFTPESELFYEIISYLQQLTDKTIFKDYNFKRKHKHHFNKPLPFAGLLAYNVDKNKDYYIVWFRRESPTQVTQMELDETHEQGIRFWEETIYESAIPWDDQNINLLEGLQSVLNDAIMLHSKEHKKLTKALVELNNELEMFTFTLSHDLKNPLSILKMGLNYLEQDYENILPEKRIEWYRNLQQSICYIEDIIENIITLSVSKSKKLIKDPIPLAFLIRKIVKETLLLQNAGNCKIEFGNLLPIWGEKSTVYQIFMNVINNAVKYTKRCPEPIIRIESNIIDNMVCYYITDNGIGVPEEELPHIFEVFSRAKNAKEYTGTGVGLTLVKRIIDRMEGSITLTSSKSKGTTVTIKFPIIATFPDPFLSQL